MTARTPEQKQALVQAYRLLAAQFDDVLIVCSMDDTNHGLECYWKGGYHHADSLANYAKEKLNFSKRSECKPREG